MKFSTLGIEEEAAAWDCEESDLEIKEGFGSRKKQSRCGSKWDSGDLIGIFLLFVGAL